ncbi:helix-turn-helix domain-containing protein [Clostridioides difficile]|uniref:helix-turn-helix domain-containing protein n=1 Tax=Clostridioides difficile TaxID=1496 RepID=UPI000D428E2C|nr:helix-turn-helix transcriptional regulator [Clostridioides difficile]MBF9991465.1 helix-turn-helix transcriptional regulator [Clostridioides difficile]MBZ1092950.1 helix-turn-helix transcriptional regulator [Clostridioides difficile]MBZ4462723.1 helix-turn-helix transcriptional regulator [Clostridioides difficile]MCI9972587.1 helix-turn-helix transcriptional regulator [Clostridioides difficile]MCJ0114945.1 helix-turn-helix transcriptional regulator [Clostridioides difficile]
MSYEYQNIYQKARENTNLTQEKASEQLGISVESLRAYENDKRMPPTTIVSKMTEIYNNQFLGYQHLKSSIGNELIDLPNVKLKPISSAALKLYIAIRNYLKLEDEFIGIVEDDVIEKGEEEIWNIVTGNIDNLYEAVLGLKFATKVSNIE